MRYKGLTIVLFAVVTFGFVFGFLNYHKKLDAMMGKEITQASRGDFDLPKPVKELEAEVPGESNEDEVLIPSLTGLSKEEAVSKLEDLLFSPESMDEYSDVMDIGKVFGQSPSAGSTAKSGAKVSFSVSLGKNAGQASPEDQIIVPNLIGMAKEAAKQKLEDIGFNVGFEYNPSEHYDKDYVYSQNYKVGAKVAKGTQVTIRISTGR